MRNPLPFLLAQPDTGQPRPQRLPCFRTWTMIVLDIAAALRCCAAEVQQEPHDHDHGVVSAMLSRHPCGLVATCVWVKKFIDLNFLCRFSLFVVKSTEKRKKVCLFQRFFHPCMSIFRDFRLFRPSLIFICRIFICNFVFKAIS